MKQRRHPCSSDDDDDGRTDLARVRFHFGQEGFVSEMEEVVLGVLSLHDGAAVSGGQLALFAPGAHHQLGVLVLQSGEEEEAQIAP